jgi:Glutathionylspermidine synthase preATP-grasp
MIRAGEIVTRWIRRAGYNGQYVPLDDLVCRENKLVIYRDRYFRLGGIPFFSMDRKNGSRFKRNIEFKGGVRLRLHASTVNLITSPHVFAFCGGDLYAYSLREAMRRDEAPLYPKPITPPWTMIMGNKAMLAVLHRLFPDHPNLLPTHIGTKALQGQKRILKLMNGCQGRGSAIIGEDDKEQVSRPKKEGLQHRYQKHYVTQAYSDAAIASFNHFRVFNVFTADNKAVAMSVREAPGPFVGGDDTQTRLLPVIVRPDDVIQRLGRTEDAVPHRGMATWLLNYLDAITHMTKFRM